MRHRIDYEQDPEAWPADYYRVRGWDGINFYVRGWHVEPIEPEPFEDEEGNVWFNDVDEPEMRRTGRVVVTMVGDDGLHLADPDDCEPVGDEEHVCSCGQVGCPW